MGRFGNWVLLRDGSKVGLYLALPLLLQKRLFFCLIVYFLLGNLPGGYSALDWVQKPDPETFPDSVPPVQQQRFVCLFVCLFLACPVDILHWIGVQTGFCSVTVQSQDFSWLCPSCCSRGLITNQGSFVTRQGGRLRPSWHRRHNSILVFQLVLAFWLFGHPWPCWQNHHNFVPFKLQSSDQ